MTDKNSPKHESMYDRFCKAAGICADNWRDPEHDLEAIRLATPDERKAIEQFLLSRGIRHYIDAEALALLGTPKSQQALLEAFRTGSTEIRAAVARVAPQWIPNDEQLSELILRVDECDAYKGLDLTLQQIEEYHPLDVINRMLFRIVREPGVVAVHYAAMLLYLHGQATSSFDWEQRPFFCDLMQAMNQIANERLSSCASAWGIHQDHSVKFGPTARKKGNSWVGSYGY